jgi:hypothetical protein
MKTFEEIINEDYIQINLKENNVKVGDNLLNISGLYASLAKISPKGRSYGVRFDIDYPDEPLMYFTPTAFESSFRVDRRDVIS